MNTKKSLLSSVAALLLCFAMLAGTTFAWFTDSAVSANNKIMAGTLKVDLELLSTQGVWDTVKYDNDPIFNYENWEPGYADVKVLKVQNEGSLALKWKAAINVNGTLTELANVIDVYVKEDVTAYPQERSELASWTHAGTVAQFIGAIEETTNGRLLAGGEETLGIALVMRESAGNEYQNMPLVQGGGLDVTILATQDTVEEDSFDNQYDAGAEYLVDGVENEEELTEELAKLNAGDRAVLNIIENIALTKTVEIPAGVDVILDLNGKTLTLAETFSKIGAFKINSGSKMTVTGNGTIDFGSKLNALIFIPETGSELVIENGNFLRNRFDLRSANSRTVYGFFHGAGGKVVVNGGYFDGGYYDYYDYAERIYLDNGDFAYLDSQKISASVLNKTANQEFVIYGGTFVGANPAWGDEGFGVMAPGNYTKKDYQGMFLEGQTWEDTNIPESYKIIETTHADGRPVYTVTYTK